MPANPRFALFEIERTLLDFLNNPLFVDPETGEIKPEAEEHLTHLGIERERLLLDLACLVKEARAQRDAIKLVRKQLEEREAQADDRAESLMGLIARHLHAGEKLKDARAMLSWRKSEAIVVDVPVSELPEAATRTKIEPDLGKIRELIGNGRLLVADVKTDDFGEPAEEAKVLARIEERHHVQVR